MQVDHRGAQEKTHKDHSNEARAVASLAAPVLGPSHSSARLEPELLLHAITTHIRSVMGSGWGEAEDEDSRRPPTPKHPTPSDPPLFQSLQGLSSVYVSSCCC